MSERKEANVRWQKCRSFLLEQRGAAQGVHNWAEEIVPCITYMPREVLKKYDEKEKSKQEQAL